MFRPACADVPRMTPRPHRAFWAVAAFALAGACVAASGGPALGASSAIVVQMDVASATMVDTTSCAASSAGVSFGIVQPGTSVVTGSDCTVGFGSTNDSATLLASQLDGQGVAMYQTPTGPLDAAFGTGGVVTADVVADDVARDAIQQPDGKILVTGWTDDSGPSEYLLARYSAAGVPDTTFSGDGFASYADPSGDYPSTVLLQPDGAVLVGGYLTGASFDVLRYTPTGVLDPSYGSGGRASVTAPGYITDLALLPDGSTVGCGVMNATPGNATTGGDFGLLRLTPTGALDTTFGGGVITQSIGGLRDQCHALAVQPDGKVLVAGVTFTTTTRWDLVLMRYLTNGTLDPSYGSGGVQLIPMSSFDTDVNTSRLDVALQPDGNALVSTYLGDGSTFDDVVVLRRLPNGAPDPSFGVSGMARMSFAPGTTLEYGREVQAMPDGSILLAAESGGAVVARLTSSGALDTTFAGTGSRRIPFGTGPGTDGISSIEPGRDGRIVVAGIAANAGGMDLGLAVIGGQGTMPDYAAGANWATGTAGTFGACLRAVSGATAAPLWSVSATCPATDGAWWNPIPTTTAPTGARVANTSGPGLGTASLRFGVRTANAQSPGRYLAPITFTTVAPAL
ncbi:MAG: hypothetical protein JWM98_1999 [Thermoleophilia bacterium]|nr:hypothetical protein [Thermoleophilia bacterium]